ARAHARSPRAARDRRARAARDRLARARTGERAGPAPARSARHDRGHGAGSRARHVARQPERARPRSARRHEPRARTPPPAPPPDATRTRAVPATARATARVDSLAAPADSATAARAGRDTAVVITTRSTTKKGAKTPEPPYRIAADHMSGGRGPNGDVLYL